VPADRPVSGEEKLLRLIAYTLFKTLTNVFLPDLKALFAVPEDQAVLATALGVKWFVAMVLFFFVVIFVIAYFLGGILELFRRLEEALKEMLRLWSKRVLALWKKGEAMLVGCWARLVALFKREHRASASSLA
jgi:hypothetical protein